MPCIVLMNNWQTSSWSITPMGGGGALRHMRRATGASLSSWFLKAAGLSCSITTAGSWFNDARGDKFVKLVMDCFLEQRVHVPTRENNIGFGADYSKIQIKDEIQIMAVVDNCDHNIGLLTWEIQCSSLKILNKRTKLCFNQADYDWMHGFVSNKLHEID